MFSNGNYARGMVILLISDFVFSRIDGANKPGSLNFDFGCQSRTIALLIKIRPEIDKSVVPPDIRIGIYFEER